MSFRVRGALGLNDHGFFAIGNSIREVLPSGANTQTYGPIDDDGAQVYFAANPNQLVFVSGRKAYYIEAQTLNEVPWLIGVDVLRVGFINQYFVFLAAEGDGFYYSEPGDVTDGQVSNFISAEASANKYVSLVVHDQRIWLFGNQISQVFFDQSENNPAEPFKADLSGVISQGTVASVDDTAGDTGNPPRAFTPTIVDNSLCWIGRSEDGQGSAWRNDGYRPTIISTFAVASAWATYTRIDDAIGYSVQFKGHRVWRIWFPTANVTWQYDASLPPQWGWTRIGWLNPNSGLLEADRGCCACVVAGRVLVGDRENGKIYELTIEALDDAGDRMLLLRRAPVLNAENRALSFPWFELVMETGVGDGSNLDPELGPVTPEADPQVMIRYSDDWGQTWSLEEFVSIGKQGEYEMRVYLTRLGRAVNRVFEISFTASVRIAIADALLENPQKGT